MKLIFTLVTALLTWHSASAQERTISGRLTGEDGSPLPGVNITIKGTSDGTITDAEGNYSIKVPIGSTLLFSFIGMQTREVVVTETNLQPVKSKEGRDHNKSKNRNSGLPPIPKSLYRDSTLQRENGIAVLTNETPTYKSTSKIDPTTLRSIRQRGTSYTIKSDTDPVPNTGFALQFSTSLGLEQVNKLPAFQTQYAQGRSDGDTFQWRGADEGEIFSWGPLVRTLEFDGSNYPFDKNGKLVTGGTGNGNAAKKYETHSFFRTGWVNVNEVMLTLPLPRNGTLIFDFENRTRTGVIPNAQYRKLNASASIKNYKLIEDIRVNTSVSFNRSTGDLLNRGANMSTIIGSIYRTPVTFDNANALSPTSARTSKESYEFVDGSKRSHSPGSADNPYGLINELPDNEEFHRLIANANLQYLPVGHFSLVFNGNIDQQWNTSVFGAPPGYSGFLAGRLTDRKDNQMLFNSIVTAAYHNYLYDGDFKLSASYRTEHSARGLTRTDGFNFSTKESFGVLNEADSLVTINKDVDRTTHEIIVNAQYDLNGWINIRFTNTNYFSNTVNNKQYTNLFPTASVNFKISELLGLWYVDYLRVYAAASRTIREAPLLYSNWSHGSTTLPVEAYTGFYESNELFFTKGIAPETERKFETGLKFQDGPFLAEFSYYDNMTRDFIVPVNTSDGVALMNAASIKNFGGIISAGYTGYMANGAWGLDLKWSKYKSMVQEIQSSEEWIAIAGFQDAQAVLSADKPVGAIYGTTYARNNEGKKIIGDDGYPIKNNELQMIGNSIPNWNLGWSAFIEWKQFKCSLLLDFKNGGEIWNGTNSVLDFVGRSSNTGDLRNIANYVFEGVDGSGSPNTVPVNFYDPENPVTDNRWVRYGWSGVGEDYIEDASWIRLSELVLSYTIHQHHKAAIKKIKFSLIGRNLFLITPYSGVDPSATLFGYGAGNGLDLFNTPSTRSYNAQITISI